MFLIRSPSEHHSKIAPHATTWEVVPKLFLSYSSITQGLHCGGSYPINTLVTSTRCFLFMSFVQSRPFSRGVRGACFVHRLTLKSIFRRMPIRLSIVIFTEPIKRQNGPPTVPPPISIHPTAWTGWRCPSNRLPEPSFSTRGELRLVRLPNCAFTNWCLRTRR